MTEKKTQKKTTKPKKTQAEQDAAALRKAFKELQVSDFMKYLRSPWRIMWHNFLAGVFRGLGTIVGVTVVFALLIWFVTQMVDFPLIGEYFEDLKNLLEQFSEDVVEEVSEPEANENPQ